MRPCPTQTDVLGAVQWVAQQFRVRTVAFILFVPAVDHVAFSCSSVRGCSEPDVVQPCVGSIITIEPSELSVLK